MERRSFLSNWPELIKMVIIAIVSGLIPAVIFVTRMTDRVGAMDCSITAHHTIDDRRDTDLDKRVTVLETSMANFINNLDSRLSRIERKLDNLR